MAKVTKKTVIPLLPPDAPVTVAVTVAMGPPQPSPVAVAKAADPSPVSPPEPIPLPQPTPEPVPIPAIQSMYEVVGYSWSVNGQLITMRLGIYETRAEALASAAALQSSVSGSIGIQALDLELV